MTFNPGDILYRKYSDKNDLYCILAIYDHSINPDFTMVRLFPYYSHRGENFLTETDTNIEAWYSQVDLNNYDIKDKFLVKIKAYLDENLGQVISYKEILDNLTYIEILAALKKYEKSDIVEEK